MEPFLIDVKPGRGPRAVEPRGRGVPLRARRQLEVEYGKDTHVLGVGRQHLLRLDRPAPGALRGRGPRAHPRRRLRTGVGAPDMALHTDLTIGQYFEKQVAADPDRDFVVYPDRDLRWTYAEFDERVDRLAKGAARHRHRQGRPRGDLGAQRARLAHVHVRDRQDRRRARDREPGLQEPRARLRHQAVRHEGARHHRRLPRRRLRARSSADLVPESSTQERGHLDSPEFPMLKSLIYMGPEKHRGFYNVPELLVLGEHMPDEPLRELTASLHADDVVNMQYTTGTTGFPKGVMLTSRNILNNGFFIGERQNFTAADRVCLPVPLFHCFGCVLGVLATLTHGATLVMVESFDPVLVLAAVQKERATALYGVPTMFIAELAHPMFDLFDLTSLRTGIMAGSPVPDRDDAAGHRQDARQRDDDLLRPDRGLARLHADDHRRHARAQVRDGRPQARRRRGPRHRPGDRRGLPAERARRAVLPRLQHHEGLLQDARGHRRRPSTRTAGCTRATSARWTRTATTASPAASRT